MIFSLIRFLLKFSFFRKVAEHMIEKYKEERESMNIGVPEITTFNISRSSTTTARINLLIPAVSLKSTFGGISTALDVFLEIAKCFDDVRILVTDERQVVDGLAKTKLEKFNVIEMENDSKGKNVVWAGDRSNKSLPVRENDIFVSTAWWTAHNGYKIINAQKQFFPSIDPKLIYIIQDYEPNFYAWSYRFSLARSTYTHHDQTIAIINSSFLAKYLEIQGHKFFLECVFEPKLDKILLKHLNTSNICKKEKLIFVYGRPSVQRNAFQLAIDTLRIWAADGNAAKAGWKVISAGEAHEDLDLGGGMVIHSLGKLNLAEYTDVLDKSAIGLSFMVSPHPSYPPLELAAFGSAVITNTYSPKNLGLVHPSIYSADNIDPYELAQVLAWKCQEFSNNKEINWRRRKEFSWSYLDDNKAFTPPNSLLNYINSMFNKTL